MAELKKVIKPVVILLIVLILIFVVYVGYLQASFLSEGYFDKRLVSVEVTKYASKPFKSEIVSSTVIEDSEILGEIQLRLNEQNVSFGIQEESNVILKFNYEDKTSLISYMYNDSIGFNYGAICLKVRGMDEIFK